MNTTTDAGCGAVAGQVERPVRPAAWMVRQGARTYYVSDAEFVRSSYDSGEFVPLYPPEAMSAERERCAVLVETRDVSGHDGYIETSGDLLDALAGCIRRGA